MSEANELRKLLEAIEDVHEDEEIEENSNVSHNTERFERSLQYITRQLEDLAAEMKNSNVRPSSTMWKIIKWLKKGVSQVTA